MKENRALIVFAILCVAVLAPPLAAQSASTAGWPRTVTDDMGTQIRISRKPQKIVSVTLPTDEILLALVSKDRLAGVTIFSEDAEVSNVASQVFDIPHKVTLNGEVILAIQPDLLFVADWSQAASVKQLRDAGITVYQFKSPLTVREIEERIAKIATAVGEEEKARKLIEWMDARLAGVAARVAAIPPDARLSVMDYNTWGTSMGRGSSWDEIVRLAGLRNAVADLKADQWGSVPLSREKLLELDPDILMLPAWVYGEPAGSEKFFRQIAGEPALRGMRAIREGRVYRMTESTKTATSQYIVFAVEELARLAYPGLFTQATR